MNFSYTPYSLPLIAAAALSIFVAFYAWRHRSSTGASALTLLAVAIAQWMVGYIMEISSVDLGTMYIWGVSQYLGIAFAPYAWLIFGNLASISRQDVRNPRYRGRLQYRLGTHFYASLSTT